MLRFRQKVLDIVEQAVPNLPVSGLFASVGYPLFYIIWKVILPQPYENLRLRLFLAVISLPWLFYPSLPKKLKGFFPAYLVCSVPLLLPFLFSFMLLKIEWSSVWAMTSLGGLVILILIIYDWLIICVISTPLNNTTSMEELRKGRSPFRSVLLCSASGCISASLRSAAAASLHCASLHCTPPGHCSACSKALNCHGARCFLLACLPAFAPVQFSASLFLRASLAWASEQHIGRLH